MSTSLKERMKEIRTHFGLSQTEFSKKINKSTGFISSIETGRSRISSDTSSKINEIFGINETWLIEGKGSMFVEGKESAEIDKAGLNSRLRIIRTNEGLTQKEFASRISYSKDHVQAVEAGKKSPTMKYLQCVADTFRININWLLSGTGNKDIDPVVVNDVVINWLNEHPNELKRILDKIENQ